MTGRIQDRVARRHRWLLGHRAGHRAAFRGRGRQGGHRRHRRRARQGAGRRARRAGLATYVHVDVTDEDAGRHAVRHREGAPTARSTSPSTTPASRRPTTTRSWTPTWTPGGGCRRSTSPASTCAARPHSPTCSSRAGLDHQHRLVRRGDGRRDLADLLLRVQGRRAVHDPRARRAVRASGDPGERALSRDRSTPPCCRSFSPRTPSGPPAGWCTSRWAASASPRRWRPRCCSWPRDDASFITASTFLVDGGISRRLRDPAVGPAENCDRTTDRADHLPRGRGVGRVARSARTCCPRSTPPP